MFNKVIIFSIATLFTSSIFASEETIFSCNTKPSGSIKVSRNNTLYKVNVNKNGINILNFSKDYKKNTKNNFIKFNYSGGSDLVAIGIEMGYLGKNKNSLHSISSDNASTYTDSYSVDSKDILTCIHDENFINKFKEIDKKKSLPAFSYD